MEVKEIAEKLLEEESEVMSEYDEEYFRKQAEELTAPLEKLMASLVRKQNAAIIEQFKDEIDSLQRRVDELINAGAEVREWLDGCCLNAEDSAMRERFTAVLNDSQEVK